MKYKVKRFSFESGEQSALLINPETGIPMMHENLFVTIHKRNAGDSIHTMIACLRALGLLNNICEYLEINLENRFCEGKILTNSEMESIRNWCKKTKVSLDKAQMIKNTRKLVEFRPNLKRLESSRHAVVIDTEVVDAMTCYNRLSDIISYIVWLANSLAPVKILNEVEKMEAHFITLRPKKKASNSVDNVFKSLTSNQIVRVLDIVRPDATDNPWADKAVRYRNQMIINVLYDMGCRKGEILAIKATDIEVGSNELKIRKCADDVNDGRKDKPLVKTLGRDVGVSEDVFEMVENYIIKYRSKVEGSGKNPFLILSHQSGKNTPKALSISGLNKVFKTLSEAVGFKITPHPLRHTWNDDFSEEIELAIDNGDLTEEEAEDTRSYLMGWSENSGTAKNYTKRFEKKRSLRFALKLQEKRRIKINNIIGQYDEDIDV